MDHGSNRIAQSASHERDTTDYEQRHFANLCAIAFLLVLTICVGATFQMFDRQLKLEECVISGRKHCVVVSQGAPRGMVVLPRLANR